MRLSFYSIVLFLLFLALACAKQTVPTGGPKDTIPPSLISSTPLNKQTNFRSQVITLTFDEYVNINNPREQLIITPSLGKNSEMKAKKKTVTLELASPPEDSTTYTINFRESIQDLTERNPARNLKLAFSTGPYIDSLSITGKAFDRVTGRDLKNITVGLYHNADTFNIFEHMPLYFTKADDKGLFLLENLKAGRYFIYAYDDKNKNLTVDSKTEAYGFLKDSIFLEPGVLSEAEIPLIRLDARPIKLISARPYNNYFAVKTSKGLLSYTLETVNKEDSIVSLYAGADQTTINVFPINMTSDSIQINLKAKDSISFNIDTVLYLKRPIKKADPESFTFKIEKPTILSNTPELKTTLTFSKPVTAINFDSLNYKIDSTNTIAFNKEDVIINSVNSITLLKKIDHKLLFSEPKQNTADVTAQDLKKGSKATKDKTKINKLLFGKGAFISIENDSSLQSEQQVSLVKQEETSTILVSVQTDSSNFIVQLVNKNYEIIQSTSNTKKVVFNNVTPGDYQIRLIIDNNANKVWDPGNFYTKTEPEPIMYYKSEEGLQSINIKANWELGPLLITDQQHVDKSTSTP